MESLKGIQTEIKFLLKVQDESWPHFRWVVRIGTEAFDYKTGVGHATPVYSKTGSKNKRPENSITQNENGFPQEWIHVPKIRDVIDCLVSDANSGAETFPEFCSNMGYDTDSRSALETYLACQQGGEKLRRALGAKYQDLVKELEELREKGEI